MMQTKERTAYIASRYLAAFDEAQAFYGLTDEQMDFDPKISVQWNLAVRRFIVQHMRAVDPGHATLTCTEIAGAVGITTHNASDDLSHIRRNGVPDKLPPDAEEKRRRAAMRKRGKRAAQHEAKKILIAERARERQRRKQAHEDAIQMRLAAEDGRRERLKAVLMLVCRRLDLGTEELGGQFRTPPLQAARRITAALGRKHTGASYPQIARAIGKPKCHSSAMHWERKFYEILRCNPSQVVLGRSFKSWADQLDAEVGAMLAGWKSGAA